MNATETRDALSKIDYQGGDYWIGNERMNYHDEDHSLLCLQCGQGHHEGMGATRIMYSDDSGLIRFCNNCLDTHFKATS